MISRFLPVAAVILTLNVCSAAPAQDGAFKAPDSIVLKNGQVVHGLIIKNSRDAVLIQTKHGEQSYPKKDIVRIRDEADIEVLFTDVNRHGDLPPWRVIVNDLRTHDIIKSMVEIPATLIDNGKFKNVPYKSFRVNHDIEINIYGDPEDPAGVELGIYGWKSNINRARKTLRAYLAGFLTSREEVAALYSLSFQGGLRQVGNVVLEITPRSAPDAYGAWWISLYNPKLLNDVRLDDAEYARLVRPFNEVVNRRGRVRANAWSDAQADLSTRAKDSDAAGQVLLRGFYRDKNGDFRLITDKTVAPAQN